jgi:hypothetical protein
MEIMKQYNVYLPYSPSVPCSIDCILSDWLPDSPGPTGNGLCSASCGGGFKVERRVIKVGVNTFE